MRAHAAWDVVAVALSDGLRDRQTLLNICCMPLAAALHFLHFNTRAGSLPL